MQNSDKFYTFLLSHSSKSRIYFHRVEVSKRLLQNASLSLALVIGLSSFGLGIFGVFNYTVFAQSDIGPTLADSTKNQLSVNLPAQPSAIDYSRPADPDNFSAGSGGPFSADLTNSEDAEMERQLQVIATTSNAAFIPAIWAHLGKINNEFGFRRSPFGGRTYEFHGGMDIDGERGDMVIAPANGTVIKAGYQGGYGNMIEVDHGNGLTTRYGHLSKIEVAVGDSLLRGQIMGLIGSTGRSTGPHLHYELRLNDRPINPRRFLPPEPTELKKVAG